ncbi:Dyp-type peroxidase [Bradyrhizobium sp. STM 3562]|uniref:Dyp-type peroxidase n=1 Tax=Bradyrhizobium sp. STM 3562 TaxID=578924 RepID=UPI003890C89C
MFNASDVQGNILRGYRKPRVRHLILEVADASEARAWCGAIVSGGGDRPQVTTQAPWESKPVSCFNIGITFQGLRTLGVSAESLATFPTEFVEGMPARAIKLGDVGESAPNRWPAPFDKPQAIHLIASIYADDAAELDRVQNQALRGGAFKLLGKREGCNFDGDYVHFGYRDNISQPRFAEVHDPDNYPDAQPMAPLGTVLLGYPNNFEGLFWRVPAPKALGLNGTFNAFRVLEQDVAGFEDYLTVSAKYLLSHPQVDELLPPGDEAKIGAGLSREGALREIVAAQMCGRWRNGVPLALSPDTPEHPEPPNKFDYDAASRCPFGAHIRRTNPRGGQIVQRVANHSRRLVRRGMPYGPAYDPANPDTARQERGLLGNFIGASLGAQFEAMCCDWVNVGLQDPRVTGSNDPLIGANEPETSWFDLLLKSGATIRLCGLPRFVQTRGGAYTFLPSISAIRYLGSLRK